MLEVGGCVVFSISMQQMPLLCPALLNSALLVAAKICSSLLDLLLSAHFALLHSAQSAPLYSQLCSTLQCKTFIQLYLTAQLYSAK